MLEHRAGGHGHAKPGALALGEALFRPAERSIKSDDLVLCHCYAIAVITVWMHRLQSWISISEQFFYNDRCQINQR